MRHSARVDATQAEIVKALRRCGVAVEIIGKPVDLMICVRGRTELVEVKVPGGSTTKAQDEFLARWPGRVHIVRSVDEALAEIVK